LTGAKADHRLGLRPRKIEVMARAIARQLGIEVELAEADLEGLPAAWIAAVVDDLQSYRIGDAGAPLVLAGPWQPPAVQALAHAMNERLGSVGKTVWYTAPVEANVVDQGESLRQLSVDMHDGRVEMLLILSGNPVFQAPADLDFATALDGVPYRVHLGLHEDETSVLCHWHIPETHFLESWSDGRAFDGTVSIVQPLIAPLYDGKSPHELLAVLVGKPGAKPYDIVRGFWRQRQENGEAGPAPETNSGETAGEQPTDNASSDDASSDDASADDAFDDWWWTVLHAGLMLRPATFSRCWDKTVPARR
jgi:molybdopterin-containing oxidoreductase family iron-sulfur binding subunit